MQQRVASLATVVASLALFASVSSFVLPWAGRPYPAYSRHGEAVEAALSHHATLRSRSSHDATTVVVRDNWRWKRSSSHFPSGATVVAGEGGGANGDEAHVTPGGGGAGGGGAASGGRNNDDVLMSEGGAGLEVSPVLSFSSAAPAKTEIPTDVAVVGAPQQVVEKEYSIEAILKELAEIQNQGPKNYCVLGTRHCSYLHQQIIELLAYALVLSGNHVFTSGAMGTNAATIRGALRAERKELLTVVLPQSLDKQSEGSRELIQKVTNVVTNPLNDHLPLDAASRLCNSDLLSRTEQLICFAFHDSKTIIETSKEARSLNMIVTELYLD